MSSTNLSGQDFMLNLSFDSQQRTLQTVLCFGAHSDDIEIGCGGAILRLLETHPDLIVYWVVLSANDDRRAEAESSAAEFLKDAKEGHTKVMSFRDGHFPDEHSRIKEFFETMKEVNPDLIFTHCRHDLHQDHRVTSDLTWNTFRDHLILEYEIPKYDGDLRSPNFFFHLPENIQQQKTSLLMKHFATQANRHWFTPETFNALMRIRGIESRAPDSFAEGFYCRKVVM